MHILLQLKKKPFQNDRYKTERGDALTKGTHCLHTESEKWLKVTKHDLPIISKSYSHTHTTKKTYAKFQNDRNKTVTGVTLLRGTYCLYKWGRKMFTMRKNVEKVTKNDLTIIFKQHAHPHAMKKTVQSFKTISTKLWEQLRIQENQDKCWWMDERTGRRTNGDLHA